LFEEECSARFAAHEFDFIDPLWLHLARTRAAFATHNDPVNIAQVTASNGSDKWLHRNETDCSRNSSDCVEPVKNSAVLYTCSKPYIWKYGKASTAQDCSHAFRAFRQNLVSVMRRFSHYSPNPIDKIDWDILVEKVRH